MTQETIERFFKNKCTPSEAAEVKAYFEANPDALNELEQEWNNFQFSENQFPDISAELWHQIQKETLPAPVINIYLKRFAAAASVILVLCAAWYFLIHKNETSKNSIAQVINTLKTVSNTTKSKITIQLSDSSTVELMPGSSITFAEQFDSLKREVSLKGEALFTVTKNPYRPFSVISDSIITTVLGTKFTVSSYNYEGQIKVSLHEGKVMITPHGATFKGNKKVYYLYPGDVFVYSKKTSVVVVKTNTPNSNATNKSIGPDKGNSIMQSNNWYMFNNQPLNEVIDQLEILYDTKIEYKKDDIKGMTFIGKVDKSDSLEKILNSIALLNNLQIIRHGNTYLLHK